MTGIFTRGIFSAKALTKSKNTKLKNINLIFNFHSFIGFVHNKALMSEKAFD